jgi:hypothetical protein
MFNPLHFRMFQGKTKPQTRTSTHARTHTHTHIHMTSHLACLQKSVQSLCGRSQLCAFGSHAHTHVHTATYTHSLTHSHIHSIATHSHTHTQPRSHTDTYTHSHTATHSHIATHSHKHTSHLHQAAQLWHVVPCQVGVLQHNPARVTYTVADELVSSSALAPANGHVMHL